LILKSNVFGIDLGTGNIKIKSKNEKKFLFERNMIAIKDDEQILSLGDGAFSMFEKAPKNIEVSCPMVGGVIGSITNMEILLYGLLKKISTMGARHATFYMAVPTDVSEVEKRAFYAVVKSATIRARKVWIVEKAIADAVYLNLDFISQRGNMIVNIGADTTEITVLCGGKIIISKTLKIGGRKLDEDICTIVRRRYNLNIGLTTGERLKNEMAYMYNESPKTMKVFGISMIAGLPKEVEISSAVVSEAIQDTIEYISDSIISSIERTPPELVKDILKSGIYLTGGVTQIENLANYFTLETGINMNLCDDPINSTVNGLVKIMKNKEYQDLAYSIKEISNYAR
jgi:rod shape-determining protein MreB